MKVKPVRFNEENLHRHPDFAPPPPKPEETTAIKREVLQTSARSNQTMRTQADYPTSVIAGEFDDEFDGNLFDGVEISEHTGDDFTFEQSTLQTFEPVKPISANNPTAPAQSARPQRPSNQRVQTTPATRASNVSQHPQPSNKNNNFNVGKQSNHPHPRGPQTPVPPQNLPRSDLNRPRAPPTAIGTHAVPMNGPQNTNQQAQNQNSRPTPPQAQQTRSGVQGVSTSISDQPTLANKPMVGFITSRAAELVQNSESTSSITTLPTFNPHAESPVPKAKRTPGIDHTRSIPIKRGEVASPSAPALAVPNPSTSNGGDSNGGGSVSTRPGVTGALPRGGGGGTNNHYTNPQQDMNRRIGMPSGMGVVGGGGVSPSMNRGAYKPPMKRPPLQDVSNSNHRNDAGTSEPDAKRLKMEEGHVPTLEVASATHVT